MLREMPKGPDLQIHIDFEALEAEKKKAIKDAGFIYDLVKDQVEKNPKTGVWEKNGIPLSDLAKLYEGTDNNDPYNKH